jgi:murein DD-endopeptidase MepM/ murein hydrolase activator NlpD
VSEIGRRDFVLAGFALAALPSAARSQAAAQAAPVAVPGAAVQGALVIGEVGPGAEVFVDGRPVRVQSGKFCFGFGRDAVKPAELRVRFADGREIARAVSPQKRNFVIQRIDGLPEQYVSPPPDVLERIKRDAYAVGEARARDTDATWFADKFIWPTDGPISSIYGSQRILNGEPREAHYGVDIAAPEGAPIRAPVGGIVALAQDLYLSGNTMVIDHGHGVSTSYLHMSRIDVKPGDRLNQGDQIGLVGKTGRATGPHLCWRLNWFQTRLDVALLSPPRKGDRA